MRRTIAGILIGAVVLTVACTRSQADAAQLTAAVAKDGTAACCSYAQADAALLKCAVNSDKVSTTAKRFTDLTSINQLREIFDKDVGATRIILLVSPTCSVCVRGAGWVQKEILEANPDSRIRVYAVWFSMLETDAKEQWKHSRMTDSRVAHFWDEQKLLGKRLAKHIEPKSDWLIRTKSKVEWDAIYLFGPEAVWGENKEIPSPLIVWGRTILGARKKIMAKIPSLLNEKKR